MAPQPGSYTGSTSTENSSRFRVEDLFQDPKLLGLIDQALTGNLEQKILAQEAQIAANEILARRGTYLPFISAGAGAGLNKASLFTPEGAGIRDDPLSPLQFLPNPTGNFIFMPLPHVAAGRPEAAPECQGRGARFLAANEERNYYNRLVADIAENYYELIMLDKRIEILDQTIALQEGEPQGRHPQEGRGVVATELDVQRFQAEVRRKSERKAGS